MPIKETPTCAKCGSDILPQPELGERQGSRMQFKHPAESWILWLCADCKAPLYELYFPYVEMFLPEGTLTGKDKMDYLPRVPDESGHASASAPPTTRRAD